MKILLVLPRPLFPADTGGKIRTWNICQRLSDRAEIHAVSLANRETDAAGIARMSEAFCTYTPVPWNETPKFSPGFYVEFLRSRFGPLPYFLSKYDLEAFRKGVADLVARESFDVVLYDFLHSAAAMPDTPGAPQVLFEHNVEYVIRRRHWERETHPIRKWLLNAEWKKARSVEQSVCRSVDRVIAVSEDDGRMIREEFGVPHVSVLPTGVDIQYFQPQPGQQRGNIVFVGSMDWYPNEEGILWFLETVYPRVCQQIPDVRVTVVGRNPSARLRQMATANAGIEVTGAVPDVRPFLARANVVIVPLRIGGGTRIKIFEAMAMERAVVSTTIGAEGLPVGHGREILLEDDAERFAGAVVSLVRDAARCSTLGQAARAKVARDHTWESVAREMERILQSVVECARPVPLEA